MCEGVKGVRWGGVFCRHGSTNENSLDCRDGRTRRGSWEEHRSRRTGFKQLLQTQKSPRRQHEWISQLESLQPSGPSAGVSMCMLGELLEEHCCIQGVRNPDSALRVGGKLGSSDGVNLWPSDRHNIQSEKETVVISFRETKRSFPCCSCDESTDWQR